jgi:NAD(P)-dependent dehydrogenase (short-subunit alcohol dehydrogenase family)
MKRFILVTGASTGIGRHACAIFSRSGYHIMAGVRREADARNLREELGDAMHPLMLDVTSDESIAKAVDDARTILGPGDALVAMINNAGIAVHGPVLHIPPEEWARQFDTNVTGVVRVIQAFYPLLIRQDTRADDHPRRIVNISSISGRFASPFVGPYAASKYALEAMSDSLRRELFMDDVRVVLIQPGKIRTPIWEKAKAGPDYAGTPYAEIFQHKDKILERNMEEGLPVDALSPALLRSVRARRVRNRYLVVRRSWLLRLLTSMPSSWLDRLIRRKLRSRTGFRPV